VGKFLPLAGLTAPSAAIVGMAAMVGAGTGGVMTRMAKKLNLQESRVVISCLYSLTACRPVEF